MKTSSEVFKWYEGLAKRAKAGELTYDILEGQDGIHDCVDLTFNSEPDLVTDHLRYHPIFILFYKPLPDAIEDPAYGMPPGCKETGEFDCIFTYTDNGFGEGLFLDEQHHPELFEVVCSLVKAGLSKLHN